MQKIVGDINSRSVLGERRQNQRTVSRGRSSQSEEVLTVCGG